jgi:radical SAM superfamily enzyme YgiQ (UPF0313 family)
MVTLGIWNGKSITISSRTNCLTVSIANPNGTNVYSYDNEGRLWTAMQSGYSYRRGLNGKIVAKWQTRPDLRDRRWLSSSETERMEMDAQRLAIDLITAIRNGLIKLSVELPAEIERVLEKSAEFSQEKYQVDVSEYNKIYKSVGILPPDQYMSVVLQTTEGCSFNTCTFCNFYRDRPFRIKNPSQLRQHAVDVKEFLGDGLSLRRTIFLGDANAFVVPMTKLIPQLEVVHQIYDVEALGGIYAFLDGFSGEKKSIVDYRTLAALGVKRIYLGMECGSPDLLKYLKKPGRPDDVIQSVRSIKHGGISVGIIILLGAGGRTYFRRHVEDTISAVNSMDLDLDDIVYFSELIEKEGIPYVQDAFQNNLLPLTPAERITQGEEIESRLHFSETGGTPHISRYDIREFVY